MRFKIIKVIRHNRLLHNKLLIIIFLIGLGLRFWGINPGYHIYHQDEPQVYSRALLTILGKQRELGYFGYPALVPLLHTFVYLVFFIPLSLMMNVIRHLDTILSGKLALADFFNHYVVGAREINVLYWGRYTSAFLGSASILMTYFVGKRYFNKFVGLLAALFLAVNWRHILSSHFALVDVPNDLFLLLVFLPTLKILNRGWLKDYMMAGITTGLSMSVKLSPFALVVPLLAHFFKNLNYKRWLTIRFIVMGLVILFFFLATVAVVNIFHLVNFSDVLRDQEALLPRYQVGKINFRPYAYIYLFQYGLTPILSLLSIVGIYYGLKKYFPRASLILSVVLLLFFSLTIYSGGGLYVRNFVGIFPLLFIFSALGVEFVKNTILVRNEALSKAVFIILLIISVFPSLTNSLILDRAYAKDWNFAVARQYLSQGFWGKKIAAQPIIANIVFPQTVKQISYDIRTNFTLRELQEAGADYVLIDSDSAASSVIWWMSKKGIKLFDKDPNNFAYSTFAGSALKELFMYKVIDFTKPWQAPEANLFLIQVPPINKQSFDQVVLRENFDSPSSWIVKGLPSSATSEIGQVFSGQCLNRGCVRIGPIYFKNNQFFRVVRFTSLPIKIAQGFIYKLSINIKSSTPITVDARDGFVRVELFSDESIAKSEKSGSYIFTSARYFGDSHNWQKKEIIFPVPNDMKYTTVSFQTNNGENKEIYFDDLIVERTSIKSDIFEGQKIEELNPKSVPEDLIFISSIL